MEVKRTVPFSIIIFRLINWLAILVFASYGFALGCSSSVSYWKNNLFKTTLDRTDQHNYLYFIALAFALIVCLMIIVDYVKSKNRMFNFDTISFRLGLSRAAFIFFASFFCGGMLVLNLIRISQDLLGLIGQYMF
jgi:hypothetical protein